MNGVLVSFYCKFGTTNSYREEEVSLEGFSRSYWPVTMPVGIVLIFLLMREDPSHCGDVTPGQVVLDCARNRAEHEGRPE